MLGLTKATAPWSANGNARFSCQVPHRVLLATSNYNQTPLKGRYHFGERARQIGRDAAFEVRRRGGPSSPPVLEAPPGAGYTHWFVAASVRTTETEAASRVLPTHPDCRCVLRKLADSGRRRMR